jgi:acido-empty-quinoprotein group A
MNRFAALTLAFGVLGLLSMPASGTGQASPSTPPADAWPTYNGDYSGRRYSALAQINQANVSGLALAWVAQLRSVPIKSTPLEVNGILYLTTPDHVFALDARTGRTVWNYFRESMGDHYGHRGVGMYKDWLYFTTPDCHLISLNAKDGTVRWDIEMADPKRGYFSSMAPLIVRDRLLVGVSGDLTDNPGFLDARDPVTGKRQWRWYSVPKPGESGSETWPKGTDAITHGGGMTWMTGTWDPALDLVYWGIGNPNPVLAGGVRRGDNLYTSSIVALERETGKLRWHFQTTPHDTHDYDATQTPVLFEDTWHGVHRKLLAQGNRNGYFFVLDRVTGKDILTAPFIPTTWSSGVDDHGRPRPRPDMEPTVDGVLVSPAAFGATNWMAPSFSPDLSLFYLSARRSWGMFYLQANGEPKGFAGLQIPLLYQSVLEAIDYRTGDIRWTHELGNGECYAGVLTTAGRLLFTGDNHDNIIALNPATGKTLWHVSVGDKMVASPMTYALDGRQYVLTPAGNVVFAWALPEKRTP